VCNHVARMPMQVATGISNKAQVQVLSRWELCAGLCQATIVLCQSVCWPKSADNKQGYVGLPHSTQGLLSHPEHAIAWIG
jgi:hypothetical protein